MIDNFAGRAAEWDSAEKIGMTNIFVNEMLKKVLLKKDFKALEVGSGTGLVGLQILPSINSIVFEDTSEAMLGVLRGKLSNKDSVEIIHGEVFDYQKQDIDLVFSCMAFHHIPDIDKALAHLFDITKANATIVVGDIRSEDGSFHRFEPIPHCGFDTDKLTEQFQKTGFDVLTAFTYNVLSRERVKGEITDYEQFMLIATKK
ncbi:MAG: class I SAM-dependent methyltransferase [Paludibacter sp.]|nr:class I SAM-dependent methyltransferase [Paludibacter sp.]